MVTVFTGKLSGWEGTRNMSVLFCLVFSEVVISLVVLCLDVRNV